MNLAVPESFIVESNEDLYALNEKLRQRKKESVENEKYKHHFILKNIEYDPVHRLDLFALPAEDKDIEAYLKKLDKDGNPITAKQPWTAQRFIDGVMWSSCQVQVGGEVCLYTCTLSTASCFNWNHEDQK